MARYNNVYCEDVITSCSINVKYRFSFNEIVRKDTPSKNIGFRDRIGNMLCLDVDKIEADAKGDSDSTMDLVVGVADFDDVLQKFSLKVLLPIELKLNCSAFNIRKQMLLHKDSHTREMFSGIALSAISIFLFPNDVVSVAQNILARWKCDSGASLLRNWRFLGQEEFNCYVHFSDEYPYSPKTDFCTFEERIDSYLSMTEIEQCANYIDTEIKNCAEHYLHCYDLNELNYIIDCLESKMTEVYKFLPPSANPIDVEYLKLCVGTILNLRESIK